MSIHLGQSGNVGIGNIIGGPGTGLLSGYYNRETGQMEDAWNEAQPSAEEQALMQAQVDAVKQSAQDRRATRTIILGKLGLKTGPDGKSLVRMNDDDRRALMSSIDRMKSDTSGVYAKRAVAAASGETKLPSFLKKDVDLQGEKEKALLKDMLGENFASSTAGKQALEGRMKQEEMLRQRIQDQDAATTPGMAMNLNKQLLDKRTGEIRDLESLPLKNQALIATRGGLLQELQARRLEEYNKKLSKLEGRRSDITSALTLGGLLGGAMATKGSKRESQTVPQYNYNTNYSAFSSNLMDNPEYNPYQGGQSVG